MRRGVLLLRINLIGFEIRTDTVKETFIMYGGHACARDFEIQVDSTHVNERLCDNTAAMTSVSK